MDSDRFDALLAVLTAVPSRRTALRLLSGLGLAGLVAQTEAKKKPKKTCARAGQRTNKKRKKCCQGLVKDATGRCASRSSSCTPATCPPAACGSVPDGCGGTLSCGGCAGSSLCHGGVCQRCDVTCLSGDPEICGQDLQAALEEGGTVFVCPGRYQGGFVLDVAVTVIGAGEDAGVGTNTILDANLPPFASGRVMTINAGVGTVELERLRIIGGEASDNGGGIRHEGTTLRMTDCTVTGNQTSGTSGGGIYVHSLATLEMLGCTVRENIAAGTGATGGGIGTGGTTTLTDCLIEDNQLVGLSISGGKTTLLGSTQIRRNEAFNGGGIFITGGTLEIAETCRVTENSTIDPHFGGGIWNSGGMVTLRGTPGTTSPIVVNNCFENCAGPGGVPRCSTEPPVSCPF